MDLPKAGETAKDSFYDRLAPFYHLIYPDWDTSRERQANALDSIIRQEWGEGTIHTILDVACGIGTQALGLAALGYGVTASDLSVEEIARARREAESRALDIAFTVADMRNAYVAHGERQFDLVIACDNSVPHLLSDADLLHAFKQFYACTQPGGGCLITVRDYDREERSGTQIKPIGRRVDPSGDRHLLFQVWEYLPDAPMLYDLSLYLITDPRSQDEEICETRVFRSRYYAVGTNTLIRLMAEAGFMEVRRIDDQFYQPVLIGRRSI